MSKIKNQLVSIVSNNGKPVVFDTNIQRNDKCHCGSGFKYKHCCYDKDQNIFNPHRNKEAKDGN